MKNLHQTIRDSVRDSTKLHTSTNLELKVRRYGFTHRILELLFGSDRFWQHIAIYLLLSTLTYIVLLYHIDRPITYFIQPYGDANAYFKDINSYLLGAQATMIGLIFPIAVSLVTLILQNGLTTSENTDISIYYKESFALGIGASSLSLAFVLALQTIWPIESLLIHWFESSHVFIGKSVLTAFHLLWLALNIIGLWHFLRTSIRIVDPSAKVAIRQSHFSNVIIPDHISHLLNGTDRDSNIVTPSSLLEQLANDTISSLSKENLIGFISSLRETIAFHIFLLRSYQRVAPAKDTESFALFRGNHGGSLSHDWATEYNRVFVRCLDSLKGDDSYFEQVCEVPHRLLLGSFPQPLEVVENILNIPVAFARELEKRLQDEALSDTVDLAQGPVENQLPRASRKRFLRAARTLDAYWFGLMENVASKYYGQRHYRDADSEWRHICESAPLIITCIKNTLIMCGESMGRGDLMTSRLYASRTRTLLKVFELDINISAKLIDSSLTPDLLELEWSRVKSHTEPLLLHGALEPRLVFQAIIRNLVDDYTLCLAATGASWRSRKRNSSEVPEQLAIILLQKSAEYIDFARLGHLPNRLIWSFVRVTSTRWVPNRQYGWTLNQVTYLFDSLSGSIEQDDHEDDSSFLFKDYLLPWMVGLLAIAVNGVDRSSFFSDLDVLASNPNVLANGHDTLTDLERHIESVLDNPASDQLNSTIHIVNKITEEAVTTDDVASLLADILSRTRSLRIENLNKEKIEFDKLISLRKLISQSLYTYISKESFPIFEKIVFSRVPLRARGACRELRLLDMRGNLTETEFRVDGVTPPSDWPFVNLTTRLNQAIMQFIGSRSCIYHCASNANDVVVLLNRIHDLAENPERKLLAYGGAPVLSRLNVSMEKQGGRYRSQFGLIPTLPHVRFVARNCGPLLIVVEKEQFVARVYGRQSDELVKSGFLAGENQSSDVLTLTYCLELQDHGPPIHVIDCSAFLPHLVGPAWPE